MYYMAQEEYRDLLPLGHCLQVYNNMHDGLQR